VPLGTERACVPRFGLAGFSRADRMVAGADFAFLAHGREIDETLCFSRAICLTWPIVFAIFVRFFTSLMVVQGVDAY
jgi:hypothetical protein